MITLGIIPARYASTRFPGKPLVDIHGKPMIMHVYEKAKQALERVCVATDDERIRQAVLKFGGEVVLTSDHHISGTDRCAEAVLSYEQSTNSIVDTVINIQGDEPFIDPTQIRQLCSIFEHPEAQIATLIKKVDDWTLLNNPNKVKVVTAANSNALYFSRSCIPFLRGHEPHQWHLHHAFYTHLGMYGYRKKVLLELCKMPKGTLEAAESLEQLRWLEHGFTIKTAVTDKESMGIDTPDDLELALKLIPQ